MMPHGRRSPFHRCQSAPRPRIRGTDRMATVYMSHDYLVQTEATTAREFAENYPTFVAIIPQLLDALFKLTYFVEHEKPAPEDGFQFFAFERSLRAPYTLRSIWLLGSAGHYPEAIILTRHLSEMFVQLRYFNRHREQLVKHLTGKSRRDQVSFYSMFEDLAPGYYEKHYRVLCGVAHGGVALSAVSGMQYPKTEDGKWLTPIGCEFHAGISSFVVNHLTILLLGFLNCFPDWFPSYAAKSDEEMEADRQSALKALDEWRHGLRAQHPNTGPWLQLSAALINFPMQPQAQEANK